MKNLMLSLLIISVCAAASSAEFVEVKKLSDNVLTLDYDPMGTTYLVAVRSQKGL